MKWIKKYENYSAEIKGEPMDSSDDVPGEPINFTEVYGINKSELDGVVGYLTDEYDFLEYEITGDYKSFNIEIFDSEFSEDTTQVLKDEYREFKQKLLPSLKKWLDESNLKIEKEELDNDRNRIIIKISKISVKK